MSTTAAYPASMADLKGPADATHWNPYSSALPMSTARYSLDHHHRPRSSIDAHHNPYPYAPRYPEDPAAAAAAHHPPPLATTHSFPNLKRTYSQTQEPAQPAYTEIVQDLRDDGSKLGVNHDHKLLSFKRTQDKHTLVDSAGRIQQLELQAQLHGMFFLSEMPSSTPDGTVLQPELTCYRRNLFQISGSLITPRGQLSVLTPETGETVAVQSTEVTISAIESVDGHPVRLIVIPWKTPPPNSPEISQSPDQEPPTLPLIPFQDDGPEAQDGEYAAYPIGWRRLQFRIATANNGRRKELQQHFILHLKVVGTLANGTKVVLTESTTAPIVVRGRSPRNFQARKEIPLLGSSAGSRGQALVETGLGIVAGPLAIKPGDAKARALNLELPRTAFTFNATKLPGSPMAMRSNSYPAWTSQGQVPLSQMPASATAAYPPSSISDSYPKVPLSGAASFTAEPQEMPLQTTMPPPVVSLTTDSHTPTIRTQYAYAQSTTAPPPPMSLAPAPAGNGTTDNTLAVPRYVDSNPRPSKSPRTAGHQSVHSSGSLSNEHSEYRYGPPSYASTSGEMGHGASTAYSAAGSNGAAEGASTGSSGGSALPPRDYLPPTNTWATTAGEASAASVSYTNGDSRPYAFSDYKTGGVKTDGPAHNGTGYAATGMSHYSWSSA